MAMEEAAAMLWRGWGQAMEEARAIEKVRAMEEAEAMDEAGAVDEATAMLWRTRESEWK